MSDPVADLIMTPQLDPAAMREASDDGIRAIAHAVHLDWMTFDRGVEDLEWQHVFAIDCDTLRTECLRRFDIDPTT